MKKNIIAISREFGSGGRTIGRLVAQKLGIQFYDRDIIKKVVEESGLTRKYVEHYGEFAPSADQRFAYSFVGLDEDSNSPLVQLWKTREKVIKDFATAKPCVIVGSCADYILRDREDCLKVFLYADEETKENRIQEIYGEAGLKLKNRVKDMDVRRGLNYSILQVRIGEKHRIMTWLLTEEVWVLRSVHSLSWTLHQKNKEKNAAPIGVIVDNIVVL